MKKTNIANGNKFENFFGLALAYIKNVTLKEVEMQGSLKRVVTFSMGTFNDPNEQKQINKQFILSKNKAEKEINEYVDGVATGNKVPGIIVGDNYGNFREFPKKELSNITNKEFSFTNDRLEGKVHVALEGEKEIVEFMRFVCNQSSISMYYWCVDHKKKANKDNFVSFFNEEDIKNILSCKISEETNELTKIFSPEFFLGKQEEKGILNCPRVAFPVVIKTRENKEGQIVSYMDVYPKYYSAFYTKKGSTLKDTIKASFVYDCTEHESASGRTYQAINFANNDKIVAYPNIVDKEGNPLTTEQLFELQKFEMDQNTDDLPF